MHDECTRIGGSGAASGASPAIVSGGPAAPSGAGVGQAVFPPVNDAGTPPPPGVQQPYQQQQMGGFGPSTPPPPNQGPMGQYAPGSPYGPQQGGAHTPPPYTVSPSSGGNSGGKNRTAMVVGSVAASIAVLAIVIVAMVASAGDEEPPEADDKPTATVSEDTGSEPGSDSGGGGEGSGFKPEDKSKTIETTRCTNATDDYSDKNKKLLPDFTYKNLTSVKKCIREAGWKLGAGRVRGREHLGQEHGPGAVPRRDRLLRPEEGPDRADGLHRKARRVTPGARRQRQALNRPLGAGG